MNEHLISVIIPVYNTAEYLPRCLDSILNNTYRNLEVICINDGSKDNSLEVLSGYAAKDPRVKVIDQENAGVSAARNRGLGEATGEYIAFVDSDDTVHQQYFEILLMISLRHNAEITICNRIRTYEFVADIPIEPDVVRAEFLSIDQYIAGDIPVWGKLYKASYIGNIRFNRDVKLSEDTIFNLELTNAHPMACLMHCSCDLYYYWHREGSLVCVLPIKELAPRIRYYLSNLEQLPNAALKNIYLLRALKDIYIWRYLSMFQASTEEKAMLKEMLNQATTFLRHADYVDNNSKLLHLAISRFPSLYRLFRILHDPTMLGWEKQQRQKAREAKQQ